MKKNLLISAMLAILLVLGMVFVSCGDDNGLDPPVIPAAYTGSWDWTVLTVFVINANGTGSVLINGQVTASEFEFTEGSPNKLKVITKVNAPVLPGEELVNFGACTFDVSIDTEGRLVLANPDAEIEARAAAWAFYASLMSPYTKNVPPIGGGEDNFVSTIPEKFTGTWDSIDGFPPGVPNTDPGFIPTVFVINANGSGTILMLGNAIPCTFQFSDAGSAEKIKVTITAVGECVYNVAIEGGNLVLSNPVADEGGTTAGLAVYASFLSPYSKAAQ